ncbi:nuclear transport factor 2 family protein [Micromonospora cathayae]|uniref:Nuclear transport factor 2 family protein n=1 Tax=Micromonospora cathayae TaxID=3028804 RepID=A0ABY7ZKS5_9ACTN|nr:nuclear transport factor 2 family protein [Micromonospora sp. HUAS 3]WDZ83571.1 nuclear transport factor 2 family protein [Micromonospora sp. HUAS 3]
MTPRPAPAELYVEVQQFYARQMHLLDAGRLDEFAGTFTPDGSHQPSPDKPPAYGRADIVAAIRQFDERYRDDPVVRRHWFNMLCVAPDDDGSIRADYYALVVATRPGVQPIIPTSCLVHDVLHRVEGRLYVRSRRIDHDQSRVVQLAGASRG